MQQLAQQLTDAGLPVPPEGNMEELYQSVFQTCMDEKTKAGATKQAPLAGSPTGRFVRGSPFRLVVQPTASCHTHLVICDCVTSRFLVQATMIETHQADFHTLQVCLLQIQ